MNTLEPEERVFETQKIDVDYVLASHKKINGEDVEDSSLSVLDEVDTSKAPTDYLPADYVLVNELVLSIKELSEEVKRLREMIETDKPESTEALQQLSDTQSQEKEPELKPEKKKNKFTTVLSNIVFYLVIVSMIFGSFLVKSGSGGRPIMLAGYCAFTVLTSSMEDVYPKGSLIVTKSVNAADLKIGDDITFMVSEKSSVTHRIIGITENYQGTGIRAFTTKGVMNENPDKDPVIATNVVGKVVYHSEFLGDAAAFVSKNWPLLLFILVVLIALATFLNWNARRSYKTTAKET